MSLSTSQHSRCLALACLMAATAVAQENTERTVAQAFTLVWADEFDRDGRPDPNHWTFEHGFVRNEEYQWYQPENARCEQDHLIIEARRERVYQATP